MGNFDFSHPFPISITLEIDNRWTDNQHSHFHTRPYVAYSGYVFGNNILKPYFVKGHYDKINQFYMLCWPWCMPTLTISRAYEKYHSIRWAEISTWQDIWEIPWHQIVGDKHLKFYASCQKKLIHLRLFDAMVFLICPAKCLSLPIWCYGISHMPCLLLM